MVGRQERRRGHGKPSPCLPETTRSSECYAISRPLPLEIYLISTEAPASSSCALTVSASSWATPSFTGWGAESTRSLASLRPSPVTARTTLITWIFWPPAAVRTTSNAVFSSAASPPPPPPAGAAAATGAAAVMPHSSSILFFSSTSSRTVMLPSCSKMVSTAAISGLLVFCGFSGGFRGRFCLGLGGRSFLRCLFGGRLLGGFGRVGGGGRPCGGGPAGLPPPGSGVLSAGVGLPR